MTVLKADLLPNTKGRHRYGRCYNLKRKMSDADLFMKSKRRILPHSSTVADGLPDGMEIPALYLAGIGETAGTTVESWYWIRAPNCFYYDRRVLGY